MKIGKKQLILTGLVLTLGTAVYLNWQFSSNSDLLAGADAVSVSKELGQAEFVNTSSDKKVSTNEKSTEKATQKATSEVVKANAVIKEKSTTDTSEKETKKSSDEYFAQAKVNRQQTQDKIIEMAQDILKSTEDDETVKAEAVAQASQIATIMEQQSNVESLINSKGFEESLAFIQNGECSIVVKDDDLTSDEVLIIKDIVTGQTGISSDKIKITPVK